MILPQKHIKLSESLFALGAIILSILKKTKNIDELWESLERLNGTDELPAKHTFDSFVLALDYLYSIGAIDINEKGGIRRCT